MAGEKWLGNVKRPGDFTRRAKAAHMTVAAYARKVMKKSSKASTLVKREANYAKNARAVARKRKK